MDNLHLNILSFKPESSKVLISFFSQEVEGAFPLYRSQLPIEASNLDPNVVNFHWQEGNNAHSLSSQEIDLQKSKRFAKVFFRKVFHDFFVQRGLIVRDNFISDTEVWVKAEPKFDGFDSYKRFTIRVDNNRLISDLSLLVSFDGYSYIAKNNLLDSELSLELVSKVFMRGRIRSFRSLSPEEQNDLDEMYPVLNRSIGQIFNINHSNYNKNKYKTYYAEVSLFVKKFLKTPDGIPRVVLTSSDFIKLNNESIQHTNVESNLLLFGNDNSHYNPYQGLKDYGPLESPKNANIKFIFIFHNQDKDTANKLYGYLKKGYKSFLGLTSFIRLPFEIDTANSVNFESENPFDEVKAELRKRIFDPQVQYAAIYISRIKKDSADEEVDAQYFKIKEELLNYGITSQVIYRENIHSELFNYFLPNIAIALLAKLGGVPWRLKRPIKKDLVIGVGAYRPARTGEFFIGNTFYFQNDGRFKGFDCFESEDTQGLAGLIRNSIDQFIRENRVLSRVIIHFYKEVSKEDIRPITEVLHNLRLAVPVIIITVFKTESKDYVVFDYSYDGVMPTSGVIVRLSQREYLLCNNSRYSTNTGSRVDGFPFPIKLKFFSTDESILNDREVIQELIDQVYQFSRMYWKSVRQKSLPVTIEYSEMVAHMVSKFESRELPAFGKNNLWFL